jgi:spectinomycin phosphotransferase
MRDTSGWVVSHGEPHAGNVVRTRKEGMVVVDWDTVAFAPREHDHWMLVDEEDLDWSAYQDVTGVAALSPVAMEAYRIHWNLSEVAIYIAWFRRAHEHTGDMEIGWASLQEYLAV